MLDTPSIILLVILFLDCLAHLFYLYNLKFRWSDKILEKIDNFFERFYK